MKLKTLLLSLILASSLLLSLNSFSSWHTPIEQYGSFTDFFHSECDPDTDFHCKNNNKDGYRQDLSASDSYLANCKKDAVAEFTAGLFIPPLNSTCVSAQDKKASIAAGDIAHNNGDYKKAFDIFKLLAELSQGDAIAQQRLGQIYYEGKGVPQDYNQAVYWYTKSYNHGYVTAKELNRILSRGRVKEFNPNNFEY